MFAALAVLNAADEHENAARFSGAILANVVIAAGIGMLLRWFYFRFLDRAERRTWSPWVLVIGSLVLVALISGQGLRRTQDQRKEADELRSACGGEPVEAGFRRLPRGWSYGEPPRQLQQRFEDQFPSSYRGLIKFRLTLKHGRRAGAVFLMPTKDSAKTIGEVVDGAEDAAGHTLDRRDVGVDGRSWTVVDIDGRPVFLAEVGCRVVAVFGVDEAGGKRLASALGRAD